MAIKQCLIEKPTRTTTIAALANSDHSILDRKVKSHWNRVAIGWTKLILIWITRTYKTPFWLVQTLMQEGLDDLLIRHVKKMVYIMASVSTEVIYWAMSEIANQTCNCVHIIIGEMKVRRIRGGLICPTKLRQVQCTWYEYVKTCRLHECFTM